MRGEAIGKAAGLVGANSQAGDVLAGLLDGDIPSGTPPVENPGPDVDLSDVPDGVPPVEIGEAPDPGDLPWVMIPEDTGVPHEFPGHTDEDGEADDILDFLF